MGKRMAQAGEEAVDPSYRAFLDEAVASGLVWGLSDDEGWALAPSALDSGIMVMPFWADNAAAAECATDEWRDFAPEAVPLDFFMERWLPGMEGDHLRVGVAWTAALEGVEVPPLELQADLEAAVARRVDGAE